MKKEIDDLVGDTSSENDFAEDAGGRCGELGGRR